MAMEEEREAEMTEAARAWSIGRARARGLAFPEAHAAAGEEWAGGRPRSERSDRGSQPTNPMSCMLDCQVPMVLKVPLPSQARAAECWKHLQLHAFAL